MPDAARGSVPIEALGLRPAFGTLAPGLAVGTTVLALVFAPDSSDPVTWGIASLALVSVVAVGLTLLQRVHVSVLEVLWICAFAGFTAWTGLSVLWSVDPGQSILDAQRGVIPLLAVAALLLARRHAAVGALAGLMAACALSCVGALWVSLPAAIETGLAASEPLGYANALGLLAGMGTLLALGFAACGTSRTARGLAVASLVPLAGVLYLSASRGAYAAFAVGLVVFVALASRQRRSLSTTLAATGVVLALAIAVMAEVSGVRSGSATAAVSAAQTSASATTRLRFWAVAWSSATDAPLLGTGSGSFARVWLRNRPTSTPARNAHNVYLETMAELGLVGLALLLIVLTTPLVAAARVRAHPIAPAATGAYVAFLVHAGVDVDWELPALTAAALLCGGSLLLIARGSGERRRINSAARGSALVTTLAVGAFAFVGFMGNASLERSHAAARAWAFDEAAVEAQHAVRWAPWSGEPWRALGEAALARGDLQVARTSFRRATDRDPHSWQAWSALAVVNRGPLRSAAAARAARLNPLDRR